MKTRQAVDQSQRPLDDEGTTQTASSMEWIVSLLFWGQLLIATVLYAAVALSPKLTNWISLREESVRVNSQMDDLERQVADMRKVTQALETDPHLLRELARVDLDAVSSEEERVSVPSQLTLQSRMTTARTTTPEVTRSWYFPLLSAFSSHHSLRTSTLVAAGLLVIIAFVFFHPSQGERFSSGWTGIRRGMSSVAARYRDGSST